MPSISSLTVPSLPLILRLLKTVSIFFAPASAGDSASMTLITVVLLACGNPITRKPGQGIWRS